ncbi:ADP/ATP-dependent (S)-NAD(P)H-hydrate dehydratase [uncultured Agrococcus sp.]|uniref:ADP-dependent NAD(P)H-hydrate dehydratase n=1 Tax=uncultured Agrococcus sp. TaxID=382258 RepID=UPI0025D1F331|nr:ADP/ATP-dependent (S)-NAD(P)H-hydrate dehydratase [uncultured Agrococcus sp.]
MMRWVSSPTAADDKYSRGVLGAIVGSERYPGAAALVTEAAWRSGVGMVRLGSSARVQDLVLTRRPETVVSAATDMGRCSAYVIGSGIDREERGEELQEVIGQACDSGAPVVLDAGALDFAMRVRGPALVTPHAGELSNMLSWLGRSVERNDVEDDPQRYARLVAEETGTVVLLKGAVTHIATPAGDITSVTAPTYRLATAGSGDVLAGILGSLCAQNAAQLLVADDIASLAATGAELQGAAAKRLGDRPLVAMDVAESVAETIAELTG